MTWTIVAKPAGAVLDWNDVDGFGNEGPGYEDDEIEEGEVLHIYFSEAVYVHQIHLTDFFYENGYLETGNYQVGDSAPFGSKRILTSIRLPKQTGRSGATSTPGGQRSSSGHPGW